MVYRPFVRGCIGVYLRTCKL